MINADMEPEMHATIKLDKDSDRRNSSNHSIDLNISISHVSKPKKFSDSRYRNEPDLLIADSNLNQGSISNESLEP